MIKTQLKPRESDNRLLLFHLQATLSQVDRMAGEYALGKKGTDFQAAYFAARDHLKSLEGLINERSE